MKAAVIIALILAGCTSTPPEVITITEIKIIEVPTILLSCPPVPQVDGTKLPYGEAEKAQFLADLYVSATGCRDQIELIKEFQLRSQ